jgi:hypothetical protein
MTTFTNLTPNNPSLSYIPTHSYTPLPSTFITFTSLSVPVTVDTNPTGLAFTVDGTTYNSRQIFIWTSGEQHTIGAVSPQGTAPRYVFDHWSNFGAETQTIVAPPLATEFDASYAVYVAVTPNLSPADGGGVNITPASPDGYFPTGITLMATGVPSAGFRFGSFDINGVTSTANPTSFLSEQQTSFYVNFCKLKSVTDLAQEVSITLGIVPGGAATVTDIQSVSQQARGELCLPR